MSRKNGSQCFRVPSRPEIRAFCCLLLAAGSLLAAARAQEVDFSFAAPMPAGFAEVESSFEVHLKNRGASPAALNLSTRLWQQSASTLQPLGAAAPWWDGSLPAGESLDVRVTLKLPAVRTATALRLQILSAEGAPLARLPLAVIPPDWFAGELKALPGGLTAFDPAGLLLAALKGPALRTAPDPAALKAVAEGSVILVARADDYAALETAAFELAAAGRPVVLLSQQTPPIKPGPFARADIQDFADLAHSATAQLRLIQLLRRAAELKTAAAANAPLP